MIGRADIEGSKSDVAMNAWPPQASYPCGNFSDTSCLKLVKVKRIDRPCFRSPYSYWKSGSSQHLPFCSTRGFCPLWAGLGTPALSFDRCTAPVKLPTWFCPRSRSWPWHSGESQEPRGERGGKESRANLTPNPTSTQPRQAHGGTLPTRERRSQRLRTRSGSHPVSPSE